MINKFIGIVTFEVLLGFVLSLFFVYIVIDISTLYGVPYVDNFSFSQIFGMIYVIKFMGIDFNKFLDKDSKEYSLSDSLTKRFYFCILFSISWGLAYLHFFLINGI